MPYRKFWSSDCVFQVPSLAAGFLKSPESSGVFGWLNLAHPEQHKRLKALVLAYLMTAAVFSIYCHCALPQQAACSVQMGGT
jgi:hypothetical protein